MIASRCVPLAIGTDVGGSIRVPCMFTGVRGFKPTTERCSLFGAKGPLKNNLAPRSCIKGTVGAIGKTIDDLVLAFSV